MTHPGPPDVNEMAFRIVQDATAEEPEAATEAKPHGQAGGEARAVAMTAEERAESARNAAQARWHRKKAAV